MPINANLVPIGGHFFVPTQICQFANPGQSEPIRANPMPIRCQSGPIGGQFFALTQICQFANPSQSGANPCQSVANFSFRHKFTNMPILANPCQSVPIHKDTNFSICQSEPIQSNLVPICQSGANRPIQCQLANLKPIRLQLANPVPISQSGANSPIQRQSCTEIAYYGMPVSPSVNGRAVDRCIPTESGLAQHWPPV